MLLIYIRKNVNNKYYITVGSPGRENDILLLTMPTLINNVEEIRASIGGNEKTKVMERNAKFEFVTAYMNPQYYLPRCFPTLFPYGRGCPSDINGCDITMGAHCAHMLCRGGGPNPRSFQNCTNYIFTMYTMEMKRKIGGVAYITEKKYLNESQEEDKPPTAEEILKLLSYLEDDGSVIRNITSDITANEMHHDEMKRLLNRLIPYAKGLQGTPMQISHEKAKLMAMIASPIINKEGSFRWFTTFAPPDLYENRLMEIVQDVIIDESNITWLARMKKVQNIYVTVYLYHYDYYYF
jgi:hypothetical protein